MKLIALKMQNNGLESLRYTKLIVLVLCLSMVGRSFGQSKPPVLIASGQDTLVGITEYDFDLVLFSFSYIKSLENTSNLTSKQLSRLDSINTYINEVLTLERLKHAEKDSIILNLESVITKHEKKAKRERFKQSLIYTIGGVVIAAETGLLFYQLIKP
jgi:hypothetical protein